MSMVTGKDFLLLYIKNFILSHFVKKSSLNYELNFWRDIKILFGHHLYVRNKDIIVIF